MNFTLRHATKNDLFDILEIVNHAILHTTSNYNYEIQNFEVLKKWFEDKQQQHFPVLVVEMNSKVVGYGTYGNFREKIGFQYTVEHSVYVAEKYIGYGIGKLLLTELIVLAKKLIEAAISWNKSTTSELNINRS